MEHKCAECGKSFCAREEWAYVRAKESTSSHKKWFCSWGCLRKYEAKHGDGNRKPNKAKDEILRMLSEGKSAKEISDVLGIRQAMVYYYDKQYGGL